MKEIISSKEVAFTKADESSSMPSPEITSDSMSECDTQEPLSPLPKLIGVEPAGTSNSLISLADLTSDLADLALNTYVPKKIKPTSDKVSPTHAIKKRTETKSPTVPTLISEKKGKASAEHLLLTLMKEVKSVKEHIKVPSDNSPSVSQSRSSKSSKATGYSRHMTGVKQYLYRYSKESGPKVVFRDNSSRDTEGYGSVNCNGITFTRVSYVNGLKHNLISINQLCDANFKVLFTKTQGTIFNQNDEVVLVAPRRRDVYVIDMSSYNNESNICFFAQASPSVNWLWHKILSHHNFKNIKNLAKHNLVSGLPSLTFSKDKNCLACKKEKHHRASFKTKRSFPINKCLHLLYMDIFGHVKPQTISHNKYTLIIVDEYSRKIENLNEVRVKEIRSDHGTEFKNHKVSIIVKRHGKTAYDMFKGRSLDISYFRVFGCPMHIHNHKYHLGKFDEKANDEFFLGYSLAAKAFRLFNIRRQEMEETYHVTFSEDDEAISQSSTEGDAINFNENRSFPDDEFLEPRNKVTQCSGNIEYFPYIPAYETTAENNSTPINSIPQDSISLEEPPEFTSANDHPALSELDHLELADNLEPAEIQDIVINEPISEVQPSPTTISSLVEVTLQPPVPQDIWLREKHIELVNIIGEPLAGITTRSRVRDSEAASAHECLGFMVYQMDVKSAFLNRKISEEVYVQQPPGFESSEFPNHVCKLDKALYGLKQAPRAWYETLSKFLIQHKLVREKYVKDFLKKYDLADCALVKCPMLPPNNLGPDELGVYVNETLFRCMIGSLMYLTASRPDIQFSTCLCARYHFIRDYILKGDIELHFIPIDLQLADIFTKPLAEPSFTRLVAEL
ncbi:retrovirus-related pol polyprotein from transposon TNT 1-94, partial [Tanacetum coccineum]